jgi:hypothetical protein
MISNLIGEGSEWASYGADWRTGFTPTAAIPFGDRGFAITRVGSGFTPDRNESVSKAAFWDLFRKGALVAPLPLVGFGAGAV